MVLRKLKSVEHERTRLLWEEIFQEDTKEFLDYYYSLKTRDNEIYVIEAQGEIVSMLQLNPYQVRFGKDTYPLHYIIAVATKENYRKQGMMARLLRCAMTEMYIRKEPFTFLMPATEAIYMPFGFRFIYEQEQCEIVAESNQQRKLRFVHEDEKNSGIHFFCAEPKDCADIADYANIFLKKYDVVTVRSKDYYKTLLAELKSENGGILIAKREDTIVGVLSYAKGQQYEIREPLFFTEDDLCQAICFVTGSEKQKVKVYGYGFEKKVPVIMARVLHLETFLKSLLLSENVDCYIKIRDDILEQNNGIFHILGAVESGITLVEKCSEDTCYERSIGIEELIGYLGKVFINEVV